MEAAASRPQSQYVGEAPQSGSQDEFVIRPHLFEFPCKAIAPVDFVRPLMQLRAGNCNRSVAHQFEHKLAEHRQALASLVGQEGASNAAVDAALQQYVGLLYGLVNDSPSIHARASTDSRRRSFERPEFGGLFANSKLRASVEFAHSDVLLGAVGSTYRRADALFELCSCLVAVAVWKARDAAAVCANKRVGTFLSVEVYKQLREAAGLVRAAVQDVLPLAGAQPSADCNPQVAAALMQHWLAEAQLVTVLRAVQKGNSPSLVSALAGDTAALCRDALHGLHSCPVASQGGSKLLAYLRYKEAAFRAYQLAHAALVYLDEQAGGKAQRCATEARAAAREAATLAKAYDAAAPVTGPLARTGFDEDMNICVDGVAARVERENSTVYLQAAPLEVPPLPPGKRLVAVAPFVWPPPPPLLLDNFVDRQYREAPGTPFTRAAKPAAAAPEFIANGASSFQVDAQPTKPQPADSDSGADGKWWRWLLVLLSAPMLLVITLVGCLVWLLLLPVKCFCCPLGMAAQLIWDVVEYGIKAPFRAMLWASGRPWRPDTRHRPAGGEAAPSHGSAV